MVYATFTNDSLIASDSDVIARTITVKSGQTLTRGAVLGRITASDKYLLSATAAVDGSQTPACVLAYDVDASAADVVAQAYFTGEFNANLMSFGAGATAATVEASFRQGQVSIFVRTPV